MGMGQTLHWLPQLMAKHRFIPAMDKAKHIYLHALQGSGP